jgi:hypothetical protein
MGRTLSIIRINRTHLSNFVFDANIDCIVMHSETTLRTVSRSSSTREQEAGGQRRTGGNAPGLHSLPDDTKIRTCQYTPSTCNHSVQSSRGHHGYLYPFLGSFSTFRTKHPIAMCAIVPGLRAPLTKHVYLPMASLVWVGRPHLHPPTGPPPAFPRYAAVCPRLTPPHRVPSTDAALMSDSPRTLAQICPLLLN